MRSKINADCCNLPIVRCHYEIKANLEHNFTLVHIVFTKPHFQ